MYTTPPVEPLGGITWQYDLAVMVFRTRSTSSTSTSRVRAAPAAGGLTCGARPVGRYHQRGQGCPNAKDDCKDQQHARVRCHGFSLWRTTHVVRKRPLAITWVACWSKVGRFNRLPSRSSVYVRKRGTRWCRPCHRAPAVPLRCYRPYLGFCQVCMLGVKLTPDAVHHSSQVCIDSSVSRVSSLARNHKAADANLSAGFH